MNDEETNDAWNPEEAVEEAERVWEVYRQILLSRGWTDGQIGDAVGGAIRAIRAYNHETDDAGAAEAFVQGLVGKDAIVVLAGFHAAMQEVLTRAATRVEIATN